MLKYKRPIRVLVSYNKTNFFIVNGAMRGMEFDLMRQYEKYLARKHKSDHVRMVFVAVPFDQIIPALLEGRDNYFQDVEREAAVDFAAYQSIFQVLKKRSGAG